MRARHLAASCCVAVVCAAAACATPTMMGGNVTSRGGELGDFVFAPDYCVVRPELDAIDMRDTSHPSIVLRVVHPGTADYSIVLANTRGPAGAREISTQTARCSTHIGYHAVLYGDRGLGVRLDCTTPEGGHISGTAAAGRCEP
jgi:hypothetical protein